MIRKLKSWSDTVLSSICICVFACMCLCAADYRVFLIVLLEFCNILLSYLRNCIVGCNYLMWFCRSPWKNEAVLMTKMSSTCCKTQFVADSSAALSKRKKDSQDSRRQRFGRCSSKTINFCIFSFSSTQIKRKSKSLDENILLKTNSQHGDLLICLMA